MRKKNFRNLNIRKFFYRLATNDQRLSTIHYPFSKGQTFIEYTLLFGILISVLIAMTPLVKRGIQGMIKTVADQVGNQQGADQPGGKSGHFEGAYIITRVNREKKVGQRQGVMTYNFIREDVTTISNTSSNLGFTSTR